MSDFHRAKKRFGQNFLRDPSVIGRILQAAELQPHDRVLEIGPGLGALTDELLKKAGEVHIVEVDRDLLERWGERPEPHLRVHAADALRLDWTVAGPGPVKMVANLPYNISSQVLFKVLEHRELFSRLVLMFQKEVGDRLCSGPGSKEYGILSVLCQVWFDIRKVVVVRPGAFTPQPKVDSVVLRFDPLPAARVPIEDWSLFHRVVKAAFAQRRKTLRNSLPSGGWPAAEAKSALERAGIDPGRRAETLTLEEFSALARELAREKTGP